MNGGGAKLETCQKKDGDNWHILDFPEFFVPQDKCRGGNLPNKDPDSNKIPDSSSGGEERLLRLLKGVVNPPYYALR